MENETSRKLLEQAALLLDRTSELTVALAEGAALGDYAKLGVEAEELAETIQVLLKGWGAQ